MSSNITLFAGSQKVEDRSSAVIMPFDSSRVLFLSQLSEALLQGNYSAPLKALGFWLRESQIKAWKEEYKPNDHLLLAPIGRVFIVSPSNVEGLFAYSWSLSYLMGNQTIVRVSAAITSDQKKLFDLFNLIDEQTNGEALNNQAFLSYDKHSDWTRKCSDWCQFRMLWGSDQSIEDIRRVTLPAQSQERVFPDRYSISVLHLEEQDIPIISGLAESFARDVITFQQQACASPKWVIWYRTSKKIQTLFWDAVEKFIVGSFAKNETFMSAQYLCAFGAEVERVGGLSIVNYREIINDGVALRGVLGQFDQSCISEIGRAFPQNLQSISHYGLSHESKLELSKTSQVSQFCRLGEALTFTKNWDGVDLITVFSRKVRL
ncbi:acyl-CoA reductase [Marinomonas balearica]|uniref:Acyl-CoA reductase LuxC n=1 Tax=Marinomonas balearica TaxID=491947 RepID=A0A4R6M5Z3_9GAMM|nr:acyl-CoA reductase [Marinomonas balearica]TDO96235.1 acyl-CoA reductase LuxC [Marinomonas balearica]